MRRILYVLATIGYLFFLVDALWPNLCIGLPFWTWVRMAGCALVAVVCGKGAKRVFPLLALVVGLAGSVYAHRYNCRNV